MRDAGRRTDSTKSAPVPIIPTVIPSFMPESWGQPVNWGDGAHLESRVGGHRSGDGGDSGHDPDLAVEGRLVAGVCNESERALRSGSRPAIVAHSCMRTCGGAHTRVQGRADMISGKVATW